MVVNFWFPLNNFCLIWPIDTKVGILVAYIKRQHGIATQVSVVKVTVTKIEIQFSLNNLSLLWPIDKKTWCMGSLYQQTAWDCYPGVCDQGQGHCY